ncbi:MAG: hypothetical protein ACUVWP_09060 [bacterium]
MGAFLIALALDMIAFIFGAKLINHSMKEGGTGFAKACGYIVLVASAILFVFTFVGIILCWAGVGICPGWGHIGPGMMQPSMMGGGGMMGGMIQTPGMMKPPGIEGMVRPPEKPGEATTETPKEAPLVTPKATPEGK